MSEKVGVVTTQPTGDGDHHNSDLSPCRRENVSQPWRECAITNN